jgi:hypothetical protein
MSNCLSRFNIHTIWMSLSHSFYCCHLLGFFCVVIWGLLRVFSYSVVHMYEWDRDIHIVWILKRDKQLLNTIGNQPTRTDTCSTSWFTTGLGLHVLFSVFLQSNVNIVTICFNAWLHNKINIQRNKSSS